MDRTEVHSLEMFIRVHGFGTAHADGFPATTRASQLFTVISQVIEEMQGHATAQESKTRDSRKETTIKGAGLEDLQDDMEAISRTARVIALTMPGLEDKFRMPRNAGGQKMLATARAFAQDAEPIKTEFIQRGMPETFIDDLNATIKEIEESVNNRALHTGASISASTAIDDTIKRGMLAVRELDVIVRNVFRNDPATLAEWISARHIERAPKPATGHDAPKPAQ